MREFGQRGSVWEISSYIPNDYTSEHPARMQPQLARDLIRSYTNPGDTVLDNFMGTATTCQEALFLNRHYIGFDIWDVAFRIAERRMKEAWEEYLR